MKILNTIELVEFMDGDISLAERSDTGTFIGEIYLSPEEQMKLLEYLQNKFSSNSVLVLRTG